MSEVAISVVIATRNRAALLRECVSSLAKQSLSPHSFEVIVVNDGSNDETPYLLSLLEREFPTHFVRINQINHGVSAARNAGIAVAKGSIVAFTDDDCIPPFDWLEQMFRLWGVADEHVAGIGGRLNTITTGNASFVSYFLRYIDEFNHIPVLTHWRIHPVHVSILNGYETIPYLRTSNASFRKKYLDEMGGFDPAFRTPGGEDPDLCYRLMKRGYSFYFDKNLVVDHHSRESVNAYFRTIRNYVMGEVRKSHKRNLYPKTVARNYCFIGVQKFVSFVFSLASLPIACMRLVFVKDVPFKYRFLFPFVVTISKLYALVISIKAYIKRV